MLTSPPSHAWDEDGIAPIGPSGVLASGGFKSGQKSGQRLVAFIGLKLKPVGM